MQARCAAFERVCQGATHYVWILALAGRRKDAPSSASVACCHHQLMISIRFGFKICVDVVGLEICLLRIAGLDRLRDPQTSRWCSRARHGYPLPRTCALLICTCANCANEPLSRRTFACFACVPTQINGPHATTAQASYAERWSSWFVLLPQGKPHLPGFSGYVLVAMYGRTLDAG